MPKKYQAATIRHELIMDDVTSRRITQKKAITIDIFCKYLRLFPLKFLIFLNFIANENSAFAEFSARLNRPSESVNTGTKNTLTEEEFTSNEPNPTKINMQIGESRTINFPADQDVHVSRRGIIDLFYRGKGIWSITALRGGMVAIDGGLRGSSDHSRARIYVEVTTYDARPADALHAIDSLAVCKSKGILCDENRKSIEGKTDSEAIYRLALKSCHLKNQCLFKLELSTNAKTRLKNSIGQSLGAKFRITRSSELPWIVTTPCSEDSIQRERDEINIRSDGAINDGFLVLQCAGEGDSTSFYLHILVLLAESQEDALVGGSGTASATFKLEHLTPLFKSQIQSILSDLAQQRSLRVLAEPMAEIIPNVPVEMQSGGEFPFEVSGKARSLGWKSHGLTLKGTLFAAGESIYRLSFTTSLRLKSGNMSNSLNVQSLTTEVKLTVGSPTLIGMSDISTEENGEEITPFLSQIPLIGGLFRRHTEKKSQSRVIYIARIAPIVRDQEAIFLNHKSK